MGEPKAITYKDVSKGREAADAGEIWKKIGEISGAGHVPVSDEAAIDLTDVSEAKRSRIDNLLNPEQEVVIDENKKRGNK